LVTGLPSISIKVGSCCALRVKVKKNAKMNREIYFMAFKKFSSPNLIGTAITT
jgi:hypothetical protein